MGLGDFDDEIEEAPFRDPLPPDDRLWRHPSELEAGASAPKRSARVGKLLSTLFSRQRP